MWLIGDWLLAGEVAGYLPRGKLDEAATRFGIAYETARKAVDVCRAIESGMRIPDLTFTHHHLIAGRPDASELLEWASKPIHGVDGNKVATVTEPVTR